MQLSKTLDKWDGKSTDYLTDIFARHGTDPDFGSQLLKLMELEAYQDAANWLIKHLLDADGSFDEPEALQIYQNHDKLKSWQSQLHILQIMPMLPVPSVLKYEMAQFCRDATENENKFVRAWGYNGLYELADLYEEFRDGLDVVFAAAMQTEPASVKARLRHVEKNISANWR